MKLIKYIFIRSTLALVLVLSAWSMFFYTAIIDEINDEVDDLLDYYSESIIQNVLINDSLSNTDIHSNYSFSVTKVSSLYASKTAHLRYIDTMIYVESKGETEPARISKSIFTDINNQYYEAIVAIPTIEKEDLKEAMLSWILFLYVLLLIIIIPINFFIIKRSLRPLYKLIAWIDTFNIGNSNQRLDNNTNISEFTKLNHAVVRSNERQQQLYEQQKELIADISHELQTPLATCMNRIEVMMDNRLGDEELLNDLHKLQVNLESMIKLNRSLLLMSKLENEQFAETSDVNINHLLTPLIADFNEVYASLKLDIKLKSEADFICVASSVDLMKIVLSNLIKNAFIHNVNKGSVHIFITDKCFVIKNEGMGTALNQQIFNRFYKGDNKKEGSTGLGLAIVKSICKRYRLDIAYHFDGKHCFTISKVYGA